MTMLSPIAPLLGIRASKTGGCTRTIKCDTATHTAFLHQNGS
jgi:hypothetical protein